MASGQEKFGCLQNFPTGRIMSKVFPHVFNTKQFVSFSCIMWNMILLSGAMSYQFDNNTLFKNEFIYFTNVILFQPFYSPAITMFFLFI